MVMILVSKYGPHLKLQSTLELLIKVFISDVTKNSGNASIARSRYREL
jgi:hypothetical protein